MEQKHFEHLQLHYECSFRTFQLWIILLLVCSSHCQKNGDLRLRNGSANHEGIVEEYSAEYAEWINFCVDGWDVREARVVCKSLGFPDAVIGLDTDAVFGSDTKSYYAVALDCAGTEGRLVDCRYHDLTDCSVGFGAAVVCQKPDYIGCFTKPSTNQNSSAPFHLGGTQDYVSNSLTVDDCLRFCRDGGHRYAWTYDSVRCGCGDRATVAKLSPTDQVCGCPCGGNRHQSCGGPNCKHGKGELISVYETNGAFCADPGKPRNGRRAGNWFRYGSKVTFQCDAKYRLHGNATSQCIHDNVLLQYRWSQPTPKCSRIDRNIVITREKSISTVHTNNSNSNNKSGRPTPSAGDILNRAQLSGGMVGVITAVPATLLLIGFVIVVVVVRKRRRKHLPILKGDGYIDAQCDIQLAEEEPESHDPRPEPPCPKPRKLITEHHLGSHTLPVRKSSRNSSDYYASIDICGGDADYENIARRKIDARTGKEIFRPIYGSQLVHSSAHSHAGRGLSASTTATHARTCTLQLATGRSLLLPHHPPRWQRRDLIDPYEDTTIMVDNDLYASRDELPREEKRPIPPARSRVRNPGGGSGVKKPSSEHTVANYLPEESAQG